MDDLPLAQSSHLHNNTKIEGGVGEKKKKKKNTGLKTPEISTTSKYYKYDICG
jgi:hypothetical protein